MIKFEIMFLFHIMGIDVDNLLVIIGDLNWATRLRIPKKGATNTISLPSIIITDGSQTDITLLNYCVWVKAENVNGITSMTTLFW